MVLIFVEFNSIDENDSPASKSIGTKALEDFRLLTSNPFLGLEVRERNVTLIFFKDLKNIKRLELYL